MKIFINLFRRGSVARDGPGGGEKRRPVPESISREEKIEAIARSYFKNKTMTDEEFYKLLKSDPQLNSIFENLKECHGLLLNMESQ